MMTRTLPFDAVIIAATEAAARHTAAQRSVRIETIVRMDDDGFEAQVHLTRADRDRLDDEGEIVLEGADATIIVSMP